jgi:hypothetical protein
MVIKKRLTKAASLEVEFFGDWKAVVIGSIPGFYWLIHKMSNGWIGEILALCFACAFARGGCVHPAVLCCGNRSQR